jgi:hypothetical protein
MFISIAFRRIASGFPMSDRTGRGTLRKSAVDFGQKREEIGMPKYWPGLSEATAKVDSMTERELLDGLDTLFGRDNLKYGDTATELREELKRQLRKEFTKNGPEVP